MRTKTFPAVDQAAPASRSLGWLALFRVWLPLAGALLLWGISLQFFDLSKMTDLGLVSVAPPLFYLAIAVLILGFCLNVQDGRVGEPVLWLYTAAFILIIHGTPQILYGSLRYSWAWKHVGIIDYIQRNGVVQPDITYLNAYHNWPGFFALNALLTEVSGVGSALAYAGWAPVAFNLLDIGPLMLIYKSLTRDRRLVWLAIWFFYLTNWVGQDYFAPQALSYFIYLLTIGVCLRWFPNDRPRWPLPRPTAIRDLDEGLEEFYLRSQDGRPAADDNPAARPLTLVGLMAVLILLVAVLASTHQLTPWIALSAFIMLAFFRVIRVSRFYLLVGVLSTAWVIFMAVAFLKGNLGWVVRSIGTLGENFNATLINVSVASPGQALVAQVDRALSAFVWGLAFLGALRRIRRGYWDLPAILLAAAPFPLLAANSYGGEMLFRVYLFALPGAAFFAASLVYTGMASGRSWRAPVAAALLSGLMIAGLVFAYYGKELMFYFTPQEVLATQFVTQTMPTGSLLIDGANNWPRQYKNYEKYDYFTISEQDKNDRENILADPVGRLSRVASKNPSAFLVITRSQSAFIDMTGVMPAGSLLRVVDALRQSSKFRIIFENRDAIVFQYNEPAGGTAP